MHAMRQVPAASFQPPASSVPLRIIATEFYRFLLPASGFQLRAWPKKLRTPNSELRTPNTERRTPSAERRSQSLIPSPQSPVPSPVKYPDAISPIRPRGMDGVGRGLRDVGDGGMDRQRR